MTKPADDFYWVEDQEPHFARRKDILKAHPEVKELFGVDPQLVEANTFRGFIGKMIWFVNQIFAYAFRPIFVKPIKLD